MNDPFRGIAMGAGSPHIEICLLIIFKLLLNIEHEWEKIWTPPRNISGSKSVPLFVSRKKPQKNQMPLNTSIIVNSTKQQTIDLTS